MARALPVVAAVILAAVAPGGAWHHHFHHEGGGSIQVPSGIRRYSSAVGTEPATAHYATVLHTVSAHIHTVHV